MCVPTDVVCADVGGKLPGEGLVFIHGAGIHRGGLRILPVVRTA